MGWTGVLLLASAVLLRLLDLAAPVWVALSGLAGVVCLHANATNQDTAELLQRIEKLEKR